MTSYDLTTGDGWNEPRELVEIFTDDPKQPAVVVAPRDRAAFLHDLGTRVPSVVRREDPAAGATIMSRSDRA
jgi:hypothetical protein